MWSTIAIALSLATLEIAEPQPKGDPAVDLLKTFSAALREGDLNKLNSTLAPNVTIYWVEGTIAGRQNMGRFLVDQSKLISGYELSLNGLQPATSRTVSAVWSEGQLLMYGRGTAPNIRVRGRLSAIAQKLKSGWALTSIHFSCTYPADYAVISK